MIGNNAKFILASLTYTCARKNYRLKKILIIIAALIVNQIGIDRAYSTEKQMQCVEVTQDIGEKIDNIPNEEFSKEKIESIFEGHAVNSIMKHFYAYYLFTQPDLSDALSKYRSKIDRLLSDMPNYLVALSINSSISNAKLAELIDMMKSGIFSCGAYDESPFLERIRTLAFEEGIFDLDRMPKLSESAKVDAKMLKNYLIYLKYTGDFTYRRQTRYWDHLSDSCKKPNDRDGCISAIRID